MKRRYGAAGVVAAIAAGAKLAKRRKTGKTMSHSFGGTRRRGGLSTKFGRSFTRTKSKTKSKVGKMVGSVSGTVSHFKEYHKGRKVGKVLKNNMSGLNSWGTVGSARVESFISNHKWQTVVYMLDNFQLATLRQQVQSNRSTDLGITVPSPRIADCIYIESISGICTMTSSSLFNMDVTILDLKSNNRHNASPETWFQRGLSDGANTFGVESIAELSTYPTMSPQFKKYWSIKNKTNFVLGAG